MTKKIGYQGEAGANSHIACNLYDNNSSSIALKTFDEVFISLEKNEIDLAMIPIENTIAGRVSDIHRLMPTSNVNIIGELFLKINHCLMSLNKSNSINNILEENRIFPPSKKFAENSNISTQEELLNLKKQASDNPIKFWESFAKSELDWFEPFQTVLDNENAPFFKWFKEGKLNITNICLDRHIKSVLGGKTALIWEGEPGDSKKYTYEELLKEVCKAANALKAIGVKKGDLVCIYMPMIPEAMFAMLACARIGAPHSVGFGGFSSEALKDRLIDGNARFVITADGAFRKDKVIELKKAVDAAIDSGAYKVVEKVIVVQRTQKNILF